MDYEKLLERAMEKIPAGEKRAERFEIPKIEIIIQGNFTIVRNFIAVCEKLRREPSHLLKFFSKELATPGHIEGKTAIFQGVLSKNVVQKKLEKYIREYVLCKECKRPDTKLVKKGRVTIMICEACGARSTVKAI